ncbi:MAG: ribonuclease E/G [Lachnospiraceae bacterium]|nr:ribonuclease E/G [Lachnospiraceae bacterium]
MRKLLITRRSGRILTGLWEEDRPVSFQLYEESSNRLGNIYVGQVKKILKNIQSAFVDIGNGCLCYLSFTEPGLFYRSDGSFVEKIREGDEIVVQVCKEAMKTKAPGVTSAWSFAGEYAVLTVQKTGIGISAQIPDQTWREEAKNVFSDLLSEEFGLILRTNAYTADFVKVRQETVSLIEQYREVKKKAVTRTCFSCLYRTPEAYVSEILGIREDGLEKILVDDKELFGHLSEVLSSLSPQKARKLVYYEDDYPMSKLFSLETELEKALGKTVWLKSGGHLVIEPTEALTVIDVNSGRNDVKKKPEETFLKINREAAKEAARQIRLRNLSGIIVIDFINLKSRENRDLVYGELEQACRKDPVKTTVVDRTGLELVEITRKKIRRPLHEQIRDAESAKGRADTLRDECPGGFGNGKKA